MRPRHLIALVSIACAAPAAADPGPPPAGYLLVRVSDAVPSASLAGISQLAFRPGDATHLYAARASAGVVTRYDFNDASGALSNPVTVAGSITSPLGLAFRGEVLYVTLQQTLDSRIIRLRDLDHDGVFEERRDFVRGVPTRDHGIDQLQIVGATLYAGIGVQKNAGRPDCETVYNGTIARVADLDQIDYAGGGNYLPSTTEFVNTAPADGMLRRYAYGFRNPFGVRVDALGQVWVSDNGASFCNTCSSCANFPIDTPDFLYRAVPLGAKGDFPPEGFPGGGGATTTPFATLTTHAAVTGFTWLTQGPDAGDILMTEFGATDPGLPAGRDVVIVDPVSSTTSPFIAGFSGPTDILTDAHGRLLIADYLAPAIYMVVPPGVVSVAPRAAAAGATRIERISPNPSDAGATIEYALASAAVVTIRILDAAGREVAVMREGTQPAGRHVLRWDPRDGRGRTAAGVYFCRLETSAGTAAQAFVRAR